MFKMHGQVTTILSQVVIWQRVSGFMIKTMARIII